MAQEHLAVEITPGEVRRKLDAGERLHLIDVRERWEYQRTRIAGSDLVPMKTVPENLAELEQKAETGTLVVFCHHGMRSLQTVNWLRQQGVANCQSMAGGIDRWSHDVDRSVARY